MPSAGRGHAVKDRIRIRETAGKRKEKTRLALWWVVAGPCEAVASQDFLGSMEGAASVPAAARARRHSLDERTLGIIG